MLDRVALRCLGTPLVFKITLMMLPLWTRANEAVPFARITTVGQAVRIRVLSAADALALVVPSDLALPRDLRPQPRRTRLNQYYMRRTIGDEG